MKDMECRKKRVKIKLKRTSLSNLSFIQYQNGMNLFAIKITIDHSGKNGAKMSS